MPRIAAALAMIATAAFCIGLNIVRYPVVWEKIAGSASHSQTGDSDPSLSAEVTTDEPIDSAPSPWTTTTSHRAPDHDQRVVASISGTDDPLDKFDDPVESKDPWDYESADSWGSASSRRSDYSIHADSADSDSTDHWDSDSAGSWKSPHSSDPYANYDDPSVEEPSKEIKNHGGGNAKRAGGHNRADRSAGKKTQKPDPNNTARTEPLRPKEREAITGNRDQPEYDWQYATSTGSESGLPEASSWQGYSVPVIEQADDRSSVALSNRRNEADEQSPHSQSVESVSRDATSGWQASRDRRTRSDQPATQGAIRRLPEINTWKPNPNTDHPLTRDNSIPIYPSTSR